MRCKSGLFVSFAFYFPENGFSPHARRLSRCSESGRSPLFPPLLKTKVLTTRGGAFSTADISLTQVEVWALFRFCQWALHAVPGPPLFPQPGGPSSAPLPSAPPPPAMPGPEEPDGAAP